MRLKHKEWVEDHVDYSRVHGGDLGYVKEIVEDIIMFDPSLAKIKVDIVPARDHYNVIFKSWNKFIMIEKFYNTFLNKELREYKYDVIKSDAGIAPHPDGEKEGPVLLVHIISRSSSQQQHGAHTSKRTY